MSISTAEVRLNGEFSIGYSRVLLMHRLNSGMNPKELVGLRNRLSRIQKSSFGLYVDFISSVIKKMDKGIQVVSISVSNTNLFKFIKEGFTPKRTMLLYHEGAGVIGTVWNNSVNSLIVELCNKGYEVYVLDYHTAVEEKPDGGNYSSSDILAEALDSYKYVASICSTPIDTWGSGYGGSLAVLVAQAVAKCGIVQPENILLSSPWLNLACNSDSYAENRESDVVFSNGLLEYASKLLVGSGDATSPEVSPYYGDFSKISSTFHISVGSTEILLSDAVDLDTKLSLAGKTVHTYVINSMLFNAASMVNSSGGALEFNSVFALLTSKLNIEK